jgi:hypothetical protein
LRIAHYEMIDDAGRVLREIDDTYRIDIAIGVASTTVVGNQRNLTAGYNVDIVRKDAGRHIVLLVDNLAAIDPKERYFVHNWLDGQRLSAVGRDCDMRHAVTHCDRVDNLHVFAGDRKEC